MLTFFTFLFGVPLPEVIPAPKPGGVGSYSQAVRMAAADLETIPATHRAGIRYLWLGQTRQDKRATLFRVLAGHCNQLSRNAEIIQPKIVDGDTLSLLRINLENYKWDAKTWEGLADVDPWFHQRIFADQTYELYEGGKKTGEATEKESQNAVALWVSTSGKDSIASLIKGTGSAVPIVRGDWFLSYTAIQDDRAPGYYDFLGIADRATFNAAIGFDPELDAKYGAELRAAVSQSGIAQQPRRITRRNTIGGGIWETFDNQKATGKRNPLRVLNDEFLSDFSEVFGPLPNGMMAWGLFAADGARADSAPDFIARDLTSTSNDPRVHVGLSCVRCHGGQNGINSFTDFIRATHRPPLALNLVGESKTLRAQYFRDLEPFIERDRAEYARAVEEATGQPLKEWAGAFGMAWQDYEDKPVGLERAARDTGVSPQVFAAAMAARLKSLGSLDPVLAGLVTGQVVTIRQWEEAVPLAFEALLRKQDE